MREQPSTVDMIGCIPCHMAGMPVRMEAKKRGMYLEFRCPRCGRRQPLNRAFSAWIQGSRRFIGDLTER